MRLKFLTYRQSQIYIFTHVHKEVNTFMNSDSVAKKKKYQNTAGLSADSLGYQSQVAPHSLPL